MKPHQYSGWLDVIPSHGHWRQHVSPKRRCQPTPCTVSVTTVQYYRLRCFTLMYQYLQRYINRISHKAIKLHDNWQFFTGLFHRAIAMSGAVLNPWALVEEPRDRAFRLGAVLGCKTTDSRELVEFLRTVPARRLVEDAVKAQTAEVSPWKITDTDLHVARPLRLLEVKCIALCTLGNETS